MIKSFRHRGLKDLFLKGTSPQVRPDLQARCLTRLDTINLAKKPEDINAPGHNFHGLQGSPKRYAISVNASWRITFEWEGEDAWRVDLEQYH